jgi:outer membrane protein
MKALRAVAVAVLILSFPLSAHAIGLEVAVGGWSQDPSGTIGYKPVSTTDVLDLEKDARYDKETRFFGRAKIDVPVFPNIYLMATPMEFEGTGTKAIPFVFGGQPFSAGVDFYSKVTLNHYDVALYYGIPFLSTVTGGMLNAEAGLDLRIVDFSAEVRQDSLGLSESKSLTIPIPMIYLGAQVRPVDFLSVEAEARGMALSGNHFYDFIGRIKAKPFGPAFIALGYRHEDVKIDEEGVEAELEFSGPFLEAGIEF